MGGAETNIVRKTISRRLRSLQTQQDSQLVQRLSLYRFYLFPRRKCPGRRKREWEEGQADHTRGHNSRFSELVITLPNTWVLLGAKGIATRSQGGY